MPAGATFDHVHALRVKEGCLFWSGEARPRCERGKLRALTLPRPLARPRPPSTRSASRAPSTRAASAPRTRWTSCTTCSAMSVGDTWCRLHPTVAMMEMELAAAAKTTGTAVSVAWRRAATARASSPATTTSPAWSAPCAGSGSTWPAWDCPACRSIGAARNAAASRPCDGRCALAGSPARRQPVAWGVPTDVRRSRSSPQRTGGACFFIRTTVISSSWSSWSGSPGDAGRLQCLAH